ncbi:MAG: cupin domain-containing protein [Cytophagaceae bacterium]|nr:MAG: cupin domain-containing protein [Cytophagaceae bacterium]
MTSHALTTIYYLLEGDDHSGFHRIKSDEIWFFHKGAPLFIHIINEHGEHLVQELSDLSTGNLSLIVAAGLWFAAEIPSKTDFALVSCAVAPGFEFKEFEMGSKEKLIGSYPMYASLFDKLCR